MEPTRAYRQHHDVTAPRVDATAFRQGWRVETRLFGLLTAGLITAATYEAGNRYRDDAEVVLARGSSGGLGGSPGGSGDGDGLSWRLDALGRLRAAQAALGTFRALLVTRCAVADASWVAMARECGTTDKTVRRWTIAALEALPGAIPVRAPRLALQGD
jgi:hypothetical protein